MQCVITNNVYYRAKKETIKTKRRTDDCSNIKTLQVLLLSQKASNIFQQRRNDVAKFLNTPNFGRRIKYSVVRRSRPEL